MAYVRHTALQVKGGVFDGRLYTPHSGLSQDPPGFPPSALAWISV